MRAERAIKTFEDLSDLIGVVARKGPWYNVSVHHNRANMAFIEVELFKHLLAAAEHCWRAERDDREDGGARDGSSAQEHKTNKKRETATK